MPELPQSSGVLGDVEQAAPAVQHDGAVVPALDGDAHGFDRGQRRCHVRAVRESAHDRGALGQRGEKHRAVRDRLLPRGAHGAVAGHATLDHQDRGRCDGRAHESVLHPAAVAPGLDRGRQCDGVGALDHEDEHAARALGRVGDLEVDDADAGIGRQREELDHDARLVSHRDAELGQVVGSGDAGGQAAPGRTGRLERLEQGGAVVTGHVVTHRVQVADQPVERVDDGPGVLGTDVGPDARVPGRHPGHVAEAARGQAQECAVLFGTGARLVHQRRRHQVGYVRDHGDQAVVVGGGEHEDVGPETHDHTLEAVEGSQVGGRGRREHPHRALEEVGVRPAQADLLGSGHRMAADEMGMVGLGHDGCLHPGDVGDHGVAAAGGIGQEVPGHARHGRGRDGHEDDLGVGVVTDRIDDALGEGLGAALLVSVHARDVPAPATQARARWSRR